MSSEVYLAMQSRGFRGTMRTLKPFPHAARAIGCGWAFSLLITISAVMSGPLITRLKSMNNEPVV